MTNQVGRTIGVGIVGLGLLALVISAPAGDQLGDRAADQLRGQTGDRLPFSGSTAESVIDRWGEGARKAAESVLEEYGAPDEVSASRLTWHNTGPFIKTIVQLDAIEQFVEYRMPRDKISELKLFNGSLRVDAAAGLLSSRGQTEQDNFLLLNLANEIATGKRSAESARIHHAKTIRLAAAGKSSPYTRGLLFKSRGGTLSDSDRSLLQYPGPLR